VALSAHIVLAAAAEIQPDQTMGHVKKMLSDEYSIEHTTIQFEDCPCMNGQGGCN
jgi:Co/Zn/Cd efflux system component